MLSNPSQRKREGPAGPQASPGSPYVRPQAQILAARLGEPRRFIQVVAGPRQVGKTTLVQEVTAESGLAVRYASADEPGLRGREWISQQWEAARLSAARGPSVLVLDEVQKVADWSEAVKARWDEDTRDRVPLQVVLLGSAPLVIQRGLADSLTGRFEVIRLPHWSAAEMGHAFGWSVEQAIYFGGYPGAAPLIDDEVRWTRYIRDSIIEPMIARDVLLLTRVDKPALLRRLFELACRYSGQVLSFTKVLGQLQDAGNTITLSHYLELLSAAGMVSGVPKYAGQVVRQRASSPKFMVLNTALMSAQSGRTATQARADPEFWGRLVESAVGAHLLNAAAEHNLEVFYWRDRNREVDFVVRAGRRLTAIEVKSGRTPDSLPGVDAFVAEFRPDRTLLVGGNGISVDEFLSRPARDWVAT